MPRTCSVCRHFEREQIDQELVAGRSLRNIAESYGTSATALFRHKKDHLPVALAKAREAEEVAQADTLLGKIQALEALALRIAHKAEAKGDLATATRAIGQVRGILGLYPKIGGEVQAEDRELHLRRVLMNPEQVKLVSATVKDMEQARRTLNVTPRGA